MHPTTTTWTILESAHAALRNTAVHVRGGQWTSPTPCAAWTVAQVLQHAAGDQQAYAATLGQGGFPAYDPFSPTGDLGAGALDLLDPPLAAARLAFSQVGADDPAVPVPLPQGPLGAAVAVGACALDAAVHAWDIAVATGQPSPLDAALAAQLHEVAREIVEPLRGFAYASALPALPGDDGEPGSLLRYLGRDPHWAPRS